MALMLALAAAVAALPASAQASAPASASASSDLTQQLGANTGMLFNGGRYTPQQIDAQLSALAQTGATVARSDALWERAEPNAPIGLLHRYDWSFDDQVVRALASHGLRWIPIIDYSAPWAESVPGRAHSAPSLVGAYAAYAGALAARYGPGGLFWIANPGLPPLPVASYEIWNEPDNSVFWWPSPNPAAYADLFTQAMTAIKGAQPAAQVIVGGLTSPASFLQAMLAGDPGLRNQIDGVAIHPYGATPDDVLAGVRSARFAMRADGLANIPLYVTEFGWTTRHGSRYWASQAVRPGYISRTISSLGHTDCGVAAVVLYAWTTPESNPANPEDWFGISPPGAGVSPDTAAFASSLLAASTAGPPSPLCSGPPPFPAAATSRLRAGAGGVKRALQSPTHATAGSRRRLRRSTCRRGVGMRRKCTHARAG